MNKKTKQQETAKIEQLYIENYGKWRRYAAKYGISTQDADDVIQNIMINLLTRKDSLELLSQKNLEAYAMESLKNAIKNRLARTKPNEPLDENISIWQSPENIVLNHLEYENVKRAVRELSEVQRKIIYMLYYENKKVPQIAEELGKKENIIYTYSSRAIMTLKKYLKKIDEGGEQNADGEEESGD